MENGTRKNQKQNLGQQHKEIICQKVKEHMGNKLEDLLRKRRKRNKDI